MFSQKDKGLVPDGSGTKEKKKGYGEQGKSSK